MAWWLEWRVAAYKDLYEFPININDALRQNKKKNNPEQNKEQLL